MINQNLWTVMRKWALPLPAMIVITCTSGGAGVVYVTPTPVVENALEAVACPSPSHCVAVGWSQDYTKHLYATLIEESSGNRWNIVSSPGVRTGLGSQLLGVACATSSRCIAVGQSLDRASLSTTLIMENTGRGWTVVPSANATAFGHDTGSLDAVDCPSAGDCIAMGRYEADSGAFNALIEENTGHGWAIVPSPNSESGGANLGTVACPPDARCVAVGSAILIENGQRVWTLAPNPDTDALARKNCPSSDHCTAGLAKMTCPSSGHCIGVGLEVYGGFPPVTAPLIVEETDAGWTVTKIGPVLGALEGVRCATARHCIAVGDTNNGALIEENTGSGWKIVDTANFIGNVKLNDVACATVSRCIAVGQVATKTVIAESAGGVWLAVASPNVGPGATG